MIKAEPLRVIASVSKVPSISTLPEISKEAAATSAGKVKFPELSPEIQFTDPSTPSAIINCLSPVAEPALRLPIITLPSPVVILSPAALPIPILLSP